MGLAEYRAKRNFKKTSEPIGGKASHKDPIFVVQEHWASHLHYDFRLEAFGVLKSWAVPKGPSTVVGEKRLAVEVEDHPLDYATFKGEIPEGEYGAGKVDIWDHGTWNPAQNVKESLEKGRLEFELKGTKLKGKWLLQRTAKKSGSKNQWLLIKRHDVEEKKSKLIVEVPNRTQKPDPWPESVKPQVALLVDRVPMGDRYIHEMKFDGYRTLALVKKKSVQLITRNGHDWTERYSPMEDDFKTLKVSSAILDGEMVALNEEGHPDFSGLQEALESGDMSSVVFYAFDLLYVNSEDVRAKPLETRKLILKKILDLSKPEKIRFSPHVRGQGEELFKEMQEKGLEGIISKDRTRPYTSGRSPSWMKIKTSNRQEFVIGGYTDPQGARSGLGALLMGVYEGAALRYVGKVGTGFNDKNIPELMKKLGPISTAESPFDEKSPSSSSKIHWVKPKLVAEVEFKAWTRDGSLRHAAFKGLRSDKPATQVRHETAPSPVAEKASAPKQGLRITHPERVIYPASGTRKIDVANYYKSVAPWMLPHLAERPLSLLRCPDQAGENCFFQKHLDNSKVTSIRETLIKDQKVVFIESEAGLLELVQWGVLEPHTWQCHIDRPLNPDQIIFDLDPDENVSWKQVVQTSLRLKDLLERLELKSYLKVSGGKGLHLHVPIKPAYTWESVKAFSKTVCQQLESEYPGEYTTNLLKKLRTNKIFLDYLRNAFGATAVAPFSLRSRAHPTVAVPIEWKELADLKSGADFDLNSTLKRLATQKRDPWKGYDDLKQTIEILQIKR